jgi:hypothetical protein
MAEENVTQTATPPAADAGKVTPPAAPAAGTTVVTAPVAPVVPEKYDLKLPEGSTLDAKTVEKIGDYSRSQKFSAEQAQALLEREHKSAAEFEQAQTARLAEENKKWEKALNDDKEIGGEGLKKNVELAKRAVDKYASDEFKALLDSTGFGNHPEVVRIFSRIGKAMEEDSLIGGKNAGGGTGKKKAEDIMFGDPPAKT